MVQLGTVLVVDDSRIMRETLKAVLALHAKRVLTTGTRAGALGVLGDHDDVRLVLCDVLLPDGTAFELLEARKPRDSEIWILITARPVKGGAERARALGVHSYLPKPVTFRDIARSVRDRCSSEVAQLRRYRRPLGTRVWLVEGSWNDSRLLEWELVNVSLTGAFIATPGPIPVGTVMVLDLVDAAASVRLQARVARVQEPAWGSPGGIGVHFVSLNPMQRAALEQIVGTTDVEGP